MKILTLPNSIIQIVFFLNLQITDYKAIETLGRQIVKLNNTNVLLFLAG